MARGSAAVAEPPVEAVVETPPAAAEPAPAAAEPAPDPDEFAAAFADLSASTNGEPGDPPAEPAAADSPAADPPAVDPPVAADPPAPPAAAEPAPAPAASAAASDAEATETLARLARLVKEAPAAEPAPAAPAAEAPELYSADEQKFLTEYDKEWGDVAKGEALKRRAEYRALIEYTFSEIMKEFKPIKDMAEAVATRSHYQDVKTAVGDYTDDEREQIIKWADNQPPYLQTAYKSVIEQGTADEVADLVSRYREATGAAKAPTPPTPGGDTELSEPAKQAAAALAPVGSKRSVITQPDDPSNFDAGWSKFAKMLDEI